PARISPMAQTAFRAAPRSACRAFNSRLRRLGKFDTSFQGKKTEIPAVYEERNSRQTDLPAKPCSLTVMRLGKNEFDSEERLMWTTTAFLLLTQVSANDQPVQPDIIIRGAMIYDG